MTSMGLSCLGVVKRLNHSDKSITAVYDRNSYDREKIQAMESWSRKLEGILSDKQSDMRFNFVKGEN
jgi:hypothetical protein